MQGSGPFLVPGQGRGPRPRAGPRSSGGAPGFLVPGRAGPAVPWRADVVQEGFSVEPKGRIVRPNTRPGLGITINEAEVKKHPFQQELPQRVFYTDGSVGDW